MVKLFRCEICGDPYIGESAPANCPFCGAHINYIKEASSAVAEFDVDLNDTDRANAERALQVELSNAAFYSCASGASEETEMKLLFKALGKVEAEHASIWRKILKLKEVPEVKESCHSSKAENLKESHDRETRAIEFYKKAAGEAADPRVKEIFEALVEIEIDHLDFSKD